MSWLPRCRGFWQLMTNNTIQKLSTVTHHQHSRLAASLHTSCIRYPRRSSIPSSSQPVNEETKKEEKEKSRNNQSNYRKYIGTDPKDTTILLFPGQGAQFVGMGRKLLEYPGVKELYDDASNILGYDLLNICLNGPEEKLNQTQYCQPAILVTSLAAMEVLKCTSPWAIEHCILSCGFSVGEFAALVFTGAISFEDAVQLIKCRAEAMQKVSLETPSGMMTVYISHKTKLKFACHTAKRYLAEDLHIDRPVCDVANFLFPECKVLAGHEQGLQFLERHGKEFGISRTHRLPVSGAFHTSIMKPVRRILEETLKDMNIRMPIIPVHSNITGRKYTNVTALKKALANQVCNPVKWEQTMHAIYSRPENLTFPYTFEMGPGKQLGALLKRVNAKAYEQYSAVNV